MSVADGAAAAVVVYARDRDRQTFVAGGSDPIPAAAFPKGLFRVGARSTRPVEGGAISALTTPPVHRARGTSLSCAPRNRAGRRMPAAVAIRGSSADNRALRYGTRAAAAPKDNLSFVLGGGVFAVSSRRALLSVAAILWPFAVDPDPPDRATMTTSSYFRSGPFAMFPAGMKEEAPASPSRIVRQPGPHRSGHGHSGRRSPTRSRRCDPTRECFVRWARTRPTSFSLWTASSPLPLVARSARAARRPHPSPHSSSPRFPALVLHVKLAPFRDPVSISPHRRSSGSAPRRDDGWATRGSRSPTTRRREHRSPRHNIGRASTRSVIRAPQGPSEPWTTSSEPLIPYNVRYRRGYVPRRLFAPGQRPAASPGKGRRTECGPTSSCISFPRPPTKNG